MMEWGQAPIKIPICINGYGVPEASVHHGNTEIPLYTNFTAMVCKFEKSRSTVIGKSA